MAVPAVVLEHFEPVMGLEVHCQLRTASKAFCGCPTRFGDPPNTNTCPTCLGLPGALPVLNARAVELAVAVGLALNCRLRPRSIFARKNYFYPDLPKGYQISQFEEPLCEGGSVEVELPGGGTRSIGITRIHVEEDAGKSVHDASPTTTFVDFNRSGIPLVEIVSEADFRDPAEVHAYLTALRQLVRYLGVSDGNMEQGSLRCDVNVSVRPRGTLPFGTKVELKNLNSFRSVVRAAEHEIERQAGLLRAGEGVEHGTRLWDDAAGVTRPMRAKELAHDYRYFPDPDLLPLDLEDDFIERVRRGLPELPAARRERFVREHGVSLQDARVLTASRALADHFEAVVAASGDAERASRFVLGEVLRHLKDAGEDLEGEAPRFPVAPLRLAGLMALVASGALSQSAAKKVFECMAGTDDEAAAVVARLGLGQVSDESELGAAVQEVLAANEQAVADFRAGNARTFGFLVGEVMRTTRGRANPQVVNRLLGEMLQMEPDSGD